MLPKPGNEIPNEGAGTPPGQGQPPANPPRFITQDQLTEELEKMRKALAGQMDTWYRGLQSDNDRLVSRVQKRLSDYEQIAKAQGHTLTPAEKQTLSDQINLEEIRALSNPETPNEAPDQMQQEGESDDEFANRINAAAEVIIKESGITFEEKDPELKIINDAATKSAEEYLNAHKEAIRVKKERLLKSGQLPPQRPATGAVPGAIQGSSNTNPLSNIPLKDTQSLWDEVKKSGKLG